jgi:hypothetical protein
MCHLHTWEYMLGRHIFILLFTVFFVACVPIVSSPVISTPQPSITPYLTVTATIFSLPRPTSTSAATQTPEQIIEEGSTYIGHKPTYAGVEAPISINGENSKAFFNYIKDAFLLSNATYLDNLLGTDIVKKRLTIRNRQMVEDYLAQNNNMIPIEAPNKTRIKLPGIFIPGSLDAKMNVVTGSGNIKLVVC